MSDSKHERDFWDSMVAMRKEVQREMSAVKECIAEFKAISVRLEVLEREVSELKHRE